MAIEVWKFGLFGPKKTADWLWLALKEGQPWAKCAKWSSVTIPVDITFAAELLGGRGETCKYSGVIAGSQRLNQEYRFDVGYSAVTRSDVVRVHCRLCGYTGLEHGKFQTVPHPTRSYVAAPQKKWAKLYEATYRGSLEVGGLFSPSESTQLIFCRFDTGLMLRVPSWVTKRFPDAQLRHLWHTYVILEA